MNVYKISQNLNDNYDTYDSCIVVAENEEDARLIHPAPYVSHISNNEWMGIYRGGQKKGNEYVYGNSDWIPVKETNLLKVELIGIADEKQKRGVVLYSFNAG